MTDMRAMGVTLFVGVRVVLAVIGHPIHHGALCSQRPQDRECPLQPRVGLEGPVGQEAVKANGNAHPGEQVHRSKDRQVGPIDRAVPKQTDGREYAEKREYDPDQVGIPLRTGHLGTTSHASGFKCTILKYPDRAGGSQPFRPI
jgi:hypothetical protein